MSHNMFTPRKCATGAPPAFTQAPDEQVSPSVQALRIAMLRIGASAADVASWCEVHRSTVERWLAGVEPRLSKLRKSRRLYPVFCACLGEIEGKRAA